MINALMEAIRIALQDEFGGSYDVYVEEGYAEKVKPCFFIQWLNTTSEPFPGRQYSRQNEFCVRYFPANVGIQQECGAAADRMFWCLEYITVGNDLFRGTKMRCGMKDGVLDFFVDYDCSIYRTEESVSMEGTESEIALKGGGAYET